MRVDHYDFLKDTIGTDIRSCNHVLYQLKVLYLNVSSEKQVKQRRYHVSYCDVYHLFESILPNKNIRIVIQWSI